MKKSTLKSRAKRVIAQISRIGVREQVALVVTAVFFNGNAAAERITEDTLKIVGDNLSTKAAQPMTIHETSKRVIETLAELTIAAPIYAVAAEAIIPHSEGHGVAGTACALAGNAAVRVGMATAVKDVARGVMGLRPVQVAARAVDSQIDMIGDKAKGGVRVAGRALSMAGEMLANRASIAISSINTQLPPTTITPDTALQFNYLHQQLGARHARLG